MKMSSKKTMLTAAVLVTLSSGTAFAATPGTVDSQELFHANRLVTDPANKPAVEEDAAPDRYEASISAQKKERVSTTAPAPRTQPTQPARLRWESVDTRIAARNNDPSFTLATQKAKPVIITAEDIRREEKQAAKEGRPVQELVGDVNMNRPAPPPIPRKAAPAEALDTSTETMSDMPVKETAPNPPVPVQSPPQQPSTGENVHTPPAAPLQTEQAMSAVSAPTAPSADVSLGREQRPMRPRYQQMPHEQFTLNPPADVPAPPKKPERFDSLDAPLSQGMRQEGHSLQAVPERSVRPEGVPALTPRPQQMQDDTLAGISDEVRRHILAGQLAMEIQLKKDPTVEGMRALTQVLRDNTTLTKLQKIDFLIGFGRALHRSDLPRQQQSLLIKTIADSF